MPTLPENLSSPLIFSEVRVARLLVFCVVFLYIIVRTFVLFLLATAVCPSLNYGF